MAMVNNVDEKIDNFTLTKPEEKQKVPLIDF